MAITWNEIKSPDIEISQGNLVVLHARQLSSGTIASLTGYKDYATIDNIQTDFVDYCIWNKDKDFANWYIAWDNFAASPAYKY